MRNKNNFLLFALLFYLSFNQTSKLKFQPINDEIALTKKGGICFRVDDNQAKYEYQQFADVFNQYSFNFSFAINLGEPLSSDYISLIKNLQDDGHELMDHTPNHRTDIFYTIFDPSDYINFNGVSHVIGNKVCLEHKNVDISKSSKNGIADVNNKFVISKEKGAFKDVSSNQIYIYLENIETLLRINKIYNSNPNDADTIRLSDLWWDSFNIAQSMEDHYYIFDFNNVHITEDAFEVLANETLKLAAYYNIQRPITWIQPGGNQPRAHSFELKNSIGNSLKYVAGAVYPNTAIKTYNEYNANNDKSFAMQWGDFQEDKWYLSKIKKIIADQVAKHRVLIGHSHFYDLLGGWVGYLERVDNILMWCKQNEIPVLTYSEWSDILYNTKHDPLTNIFPPINVDLDDNGTPDGYLPKSSIWKGVVDKTDGVLDKSNYCFRIDQKGSICGIEGLGGIEKGENSFEIWTKGAEGNYIESVFKVGETEYIYKFPAETSYWKKYSISQSINGNTSLNIPNDISLIDIEIRCSDYSNGDIKVAGMALFKADGIFTPQILVTSPNGGEILKIGQNYRINWNYNNASDIKLEYSIDNGIHWENIITSTLNKGFYTWTIPNNPSTKCLVRITDVFTGLSDVSNSTFTISENSSTVDNKLSVAPSKQSVAALAGFTTFEVASNVSWNVSDNTSWLSVSPSSGSNGATLTASYSANTSSSSRTATITTSCGGLSKTVTLTQSGAASSGGNLSVNPTRKEIGNGAGDFTINITTNGSWRVRDNTDWMSKTPKTGDGNGKSVIAFKANTTGNTRTGIISVTVGNEVQEILVTQGTSSITNTLTVSPSNRSVGSSSGSTTFAVASNFNWNVSDNATWLSVSPNSGSNGATLTASYSANTSSSSRTATITTSCGGLSKTVTLTQSGAASSGGNLSVNPTRKEIGNGAGDFTINITTNGSWRVRDNTDWMSKTPKTGDGNGKSVIAFKANTTGNTRTGIISVTVGNEVQEILVTQGTSSITNTLTVSPSNRSVGSSSGSTTFAVASNFNWNVSDNATWLSVSPNSGSNGATLTASYSANTSSSSRTATITTSCGGLSKTVTLTQSGAASSGGNLSVNPTRKEIGNGAGDFTINITTNGSWRVRDNTDWMSKTPKTGDGNGKSVIAFKANTTGNTRTGIISVTVGNEVQEILVTQNVIEQNSVTSSTSEKENILFIMNQDNINVDVPESYSLNQNYPNPFNPTTIIQFTLVETQNVRISIYNMLGEEIQILTNNQYCSGKHSIEFNGSELVSGIYIYRLVSKNYINSKRMILLK